MRGSGARAIRKGPAERLEERFRLVVGIFAAKIVQVHGHLGVVDEALKELAQKVDVEITDARPYEIHLVGEARAAGKVHHGARKGLIQGNVGMPVAGDARLVTDGLSYRLAQDDAHVLHGMVGVHVEVADGPYVDIDEAVASNWVSMCSKKARPVVSFDAPAPSRSTLTTICVSWVSRETVAERPLCLLFVAMI